MWEVEGVCLLKKATIHTLTYKKLLSRTYTSPLGRPKSSKKERAEGRLSLKERHLPHTHLRINSQALLVVL